MAKKISSSFDLTETTAPILQKLKAAKWDIKEVVNGGILMFSQAKIQDQQFFSFMATKGIDLEKNKEARDMLRKMIFEIVFDAIASQSEETKKWLLQLIHKSSATPDYDINDPDASIAAVDAETKMSVVAEDKKHPGHTKSVG
jgi:hypothetical protein